MSEKNNEEKKLSNIYPDDIFFVHEKCIKIFHNIIHIHPVHRFVGLLGITNFRIFFISKLSEGTYKFEIPLGLIGSVELFEQTTEPTRVVLECKDTGVYKFITQLKGVGVEMHELLTKMAFPLANDTVGLWAFRLDDKFLQNGWDVFNMTSELSRMGIPNDIWRLSHINETFDICDQYPSVLAVPLEISDAKIKQSAKFRHSGCFPTLSWINPRNQAVITRSGQPKSGLFDERCTEDEELVQAILDANTQSHTIHIMDARSKETASAQRSKGGGHECCENYPSCQISFLSIPSIHIVRESFKKLRTAVTPPIVESNWLSRLDKTNWLEIVSQFLGGALNVALAVEHGRQSVLVHASDGFARVPVLTSLSMMMLDPFYRTIIGLEVLIEKEWLYFASNFAVGHCHGTPLYSDSKRSYHFLLFIDCVWQMMCQFPNVFEFNDGLLMEIVKHSFSAQFGTFIFNSESALTSAEAKVRTVSLWSYINASLYKYKNPLYLGESSPLVIFPTVSSIKLKFWKNMYLKHNLGTPVTSAMMLMRNKHLLEIITN